MGDAENSIDDPADDLPASGEWANLTRVRRGLEEFTIDFIRHVPGDVRPFLVARTILGPSVAIELRDQLTKAWRNYTDWSMPTDES